MLRTVSIGAVGCGGLADPCAPDKNHNIYETEDRHG